MKSSSQRQKEALAVAGTLASTGLGWRYALALSRECSLSSEESTRALTDSLAKLIPKVHYLAPEQLLPTLTDAIGQAVFEGAWKSSPQEIHGSHVGDAIQYFCRRVSDRPEPSLVACLDKEFSWFFLGKKGPSGPEAATQALRRLA